MSKEIFVKTDTVYCLYFFSTQYRFLGAYKKIGGGLGACVIILLFNIQRLKTLPKNTFKVENGFFSSSQIFISKIICFFLLRMKILALQRQLFQALICRYFK